MRTLRPMIILLALLSVVAWAPPAAAAPSSKKAIWGPNDDKSFRHYKALGAGIYMQGMSWADVAPTRPADPTNPADSAYRWSEDLDKAIRRAAASRMQVGLTVLRTPGWANGGRSQAWAPNRISDFSKFLEAASKRYPGVRYWQVWGEPSREQNWEPLVPESDKRRGLPLSKRQRVAPRRYAQLLDASYAALKGVNRRDVVIGGNTFTTGDISPLNWIKNLRLPSGRAPRMDMYGHNPFTGREPRLSKPPLGDGFADFSDLDTLTRWLDRYLRPRMPGKPRLKVFMSEFTIPTDHKNYEFNFWVDRSVAARWVRSALKITRRSSRLYTLAWLSLYDEAPNGQGTEVNRGLLDFRGRKKPLYDAYKRG